MNKKIRVENIENYLDENESIDANTIILMAELADNKAKYLPFKEMLPS